MSFGQWLFGFYSFLVDDCLWSCVVLSILKGVDFIGDLLDFGLLFDNDFFTDGEHLVG